MAAPRTLAVILPQLTGKAFGRRGLAFGGLLAEWTSIVGARLGERTAPYRIVFPHHQRENAVLHLRVATSATLDVQHLEPQLIERINSYFGYRAVARLKIIHAPVFKPRPAPAKLRPLSAAETEAIDTAARTIDDPDLREVLARFGRTLAAAGKPPA